MACAVLGRSSCETLASFSTTMFTLRDLRADPGRDAPVTASTATRPQRKPPPAAKVEFSPPLLVGGAR